MSEYILILIWLGFVVLLASQGFFQRKEMVCGEVVQRFSWVFAIVVFAPIIWMAGNRGWIFDTGTYIRGFWEMPSSFSKIPAYVESMSKDKGFYAFSAVLKVIFGDDETLYFTIIAAIQGIAVLSMFRKYSMNYVLSIFLFVASTDYISWMFNGIRQFTAVAIICAATPLMLKKKYVPLLCVILLASTFHQSALIMIPFIFIAQGKVGNKKTILFIILAMIAVLGVGQFTNILDDTLSNTQYANVVSDYTSANDDGTNPLRVLVYIVPAILAIVGRRRIQMENNPVINFCANMSLISAGLYLVSMVTSGIFIGRLPIYVSLYGYILIPWEIENLFTEETKKIIYLALVVFYLVFYYYQVHLAWGLA